MLFRSTQKQRGSLQNNTHIQSLPNTTHNTERVTPKHHTQRNCCRTAKTNKTSISSFINDSFISPTPFLYPWLPPALAPSLLSSLHLMTSCLIPAVMLLLCRWPSEYYPGLCHTHMLTHTHAHTHTQIGRASCRERVSSPV